MAGKRTRYSAEFKAKVALEALRGELTTVQLAAKHGIHQTMVGEWKRQAMEGLTAVFSGKAVAQESAKTAEAEVEKLRAETQCILIDFHAETTSEKIAFGRMMDGKVSVVVGTHTHVQTADDRILPNGTAYLTDAGFTGPHESVIGRDIGSVVQKYKTLLPNKFYIAREGLQADGIVVEIDEATGKALSIERIQHKVHLSS